VDGLISAREKVYRLPGTVFSWSKLNMRVKKTNRASATRGSRNITATSPVGHCGLCKDREYTRDLAMLTDADLERAAGSLETEAARLRQFTACRAMRNN
jgi:hypothetical protein